jgi:hypothetical protein
MPAACHAMHQADSVLAGQRSAALQRRSLPPLLRMTANAELDHTESAP